MAKERKERLRREKELKWKAQRKETQTKRKKIPEGLPSAPPRRRSHMGCSCQKWRLVDGSGRGQSQPEDGGNSVCQGIGRLHPVTERRALRRTPNREAHSRGCRRTVKERRIVRVKGAFEGCAKDDRTGLYQKSASILLSIEALPFASFFFSLIKTG